MNSLSNRIAALLIAAIFGLIALMFAQAEVAAPKQAIVKLERVLIVGKRAGADTQIARAQRVEQLPRVVVVGRRTTSETELQLAQACAAQALC
ncbi:hypothetical protein [Roseateles violae]|uniref:DUF218 domain-containing protein n=1 Tax=Roseateles violae TaxID=3058042 RepID=A0ABT8DRB3_9BURK|nr:hypothetical protein [Pelomonas sp. PFR6]MDN3918842.1 hypothetical protein [Pelomonas sp. PFR6]